jgi:uncharacterized protein (DUF427 family)
MDPTQQQEAPLSADATPNPVISPISGRVHVYFDDAEIASTLKAMRLEEPGLAPQIFIPLDAVHPGILEASDTKSQAPGKGEAHYYTIKLLTADGPDRVWYYPYADGAYSDIRDLLTFGGERIEIRVSDV